MDDPRHDLAALRRRRARRQQSRRQGRWMRRALIALTLLLVFGAGGAIAGYVYLDQTVLADVSIDKLKPRPQGRTSVVYTSDGRRLGVIGSDIRRTPVQMDRMGRWLPKATVAIEDRRFYTHDGVDMRGVLRAAWTNYRTGQTVEGASTITQQLVRNLYITPERTWKRKIREAKLARDLEQRRTKRQILTSYLNNAPYGTVSGQTAIGVQAAARTFFDRAAEDLTLAQAALLAGLPQAPSALNPFEHPGKAKRRRQAVLDAMRAEGMITPRQHARASRSELGVRRSDYYRQRSEPAVLDLVERELIRRHGERVVRSGGLRVYTTINLRLQRQARQAIRRHLGQGGDPQAAVATIDPRTGRVRALVSSAPYRDSKFSYAAQARRQPGSTFKPFVLAAALRQGADPDSTLYVSKPLSEQTKWGPFQVSTYDGSFAGTMNLRQATLRSDNPVYAQLGLDVGPGQVRQTAYRLGITSKLDALPAESLGGLTHGVTPLEMARAYATMSAGGIRRAPTLIARVRFPSGKVTRPRTHAKRMISSPSAAKLTSILQDNVTQGTGTSARVAGCDAAGKTGTTSNFKDAWFVGYTPRLATSVWVGYPQPRPMLSVRGIPVNGGSFPARIWGAFMNAATEHIGCGAYPKPTGAGNFKALCGPRAVNACGGGGYTTPAYPTAPAPAPIPGQ